ncbi:hypothetical protein LZG04_15130 [Saccharothrix sp. S26]|uniref:hypothetical protein n=1 Tax=Saccharothrix sp. S26 TaxID=2907215 RepID=UPI001F306D72|nr:hypothetical protein [Saccharothrix sp. S26]MCE6996126.1 hypothetical protein [Saccharothrix sp. S26]
MDERVRRARDQVVNMVALRPVATSTGRGQPPRELLRRDLGLSVASGVLDLLAAAAVVAAGPDAWFTSAAGIGLGMAGANAIIEAFRESRRRTGEVARIREHGADEVDTLTALRADVPTPLWAKVIRVFYELLLLTSVTVVLVGSEGPFARVTVAAALTCHLIAAVPACRYARRRNRWRSEFLRGDGVTLPPLPEGWRVLVPRRPDEPDRHLS